MTEEKCKMTCPVATTLNLISGKWKGLLIYQLLDGKK